jgi:hypothetical protein
VNHQLPKWLGNGVAVVVSVHVVLSGAAGLAGDCACRFTSSWYRHWNGTPFSFTWSVCAGSAFSRPLTPSQPPYRLSKLWFSS